MNKIKYEKINSSNISHAGYDNDSMTLWIKFVDSGTYQYFDVPFEVYNGLLSAPSAGKYFFKEIRGKYSYEQI